MLARATLFPETFADKQRDTLIGGKFTQRNLAFRENVFVRSARRAESEFSFFGGNFTLLGRRTKKNGLLINRKIMLVSPVQ